MFESLYTQFLCINSHMSEVSFSLRLVHNINIRAKYPSKSSIFQRSHSTKIEPCRLTCLPCHQIERGSPAHQPLNLNACIHVKNAIKYSGNTMVCLHIYAIAPAQITYPIKSNIPNSGCHASNANASFYMPTH